MQTQLVDAILLSTYHMISMTYNNSIGVTHVWRDAFQLWPIILLKILNHVGINFGGYVLKLDRLSEGIHSRKMYSAYVPFQTYHTHCLQIGKIIFLLRCQWIISFWAFKMRNLASKFSFFLNTLYLRLSSLSVEQMWRLHATFLYCQHLLDRRLST